MQIKKMISLRLYILILLLFFVVPFYAETQLNHPEFSSDWDVRKPANNSDYHFAVGISEPCLTEKLAVSKAWYNLLSSFASSISTYVTVNTDETVYEEGFEGDVLDSYTMTFSHSTWKSEVPLYGVQQLEKKIEKDSDGLYVVKILGCISAGDYEKSHIAVLDEETSAFAYSYFQDKTASGFISKTDSTYTKWIKKNCVVLEFAEKSDGEKFAALAEAFLSKLYRNVLLYRCSFGGFPSVIIYNHPDYYDTTISAFEKTACFNIERNGSITRFSSKPKSSYSDFSTYCAEMKDSKKLSVFGTETFYLPSGASFINPDCRITTRFSDLSQKQFGFSVQKSSQKFDSFEQMKDYAQSHKKDFSSRYFAFCTAETSAETMGKKAWVNAAVSFILFDLETGEEWASGTAESMPMSAVVPFPSDEQVKAKSRTAIDNACNPDKNPESLIVIMQEAFSQLP